MPPASGPRQIIVAVIASIAARSPSPRRSRPKSTHPVIPHMFPGPRLAVIRYEGKEGLLNIN